MTLPPVRIDAPARRAWQGDHLIPLGQREYDLLALLVQHPGTASFDRISRTVYGQPLDERTTRMVQQLAGALRVKLDDRHPHQYVVSVRGVGFRMPRTLVAPPSQRVEIEGVQYEVIHWARQADHGATAAWTLYARPAGVVADV